MNLRNTYRDWQEGIRAIVTQLLAFETANTSALDLKANIASPTFTGTVTIPTPFTLGAVSVTPTGTELNYVDGVTSNIQTQLDAKTSINKIINGKMEVAQRGTSFPAIAAASYSLDRWAFGNTSSAVLTASQQSDVPSSTSEFQNSLRFETTTADTSIISTDQAHIRQGVEGFNVRDLIGRTFTLSFWVRSSKTGTHCVSFANSAGDRSYVVEYTINAIDTWEYKTISVDGGLISAGTWVWTNGIGLHVRFALAAGSTYQTTAGAWQTGNFTATSGQVNCLDTIGNIFAITGVQLELGTVASPFVHRHYMYELALCRRYTRIQDYYIPATTAQNLGTIDMRTTPTITGGGAGFTSTGTTADQLIAYQTAGAVATLTLVAEL